MFLLPFQPFPCYCYLLPLLPRRSFPFFSFPSSPSVLDGWYTISFVSHFFPSPLPSHPLSFAPFMRLLPTHPPAFSTTHPPAFSTILGMAVLLLTFFIQQLLPSDSRRVKFTWGWMKAELGIDCGKKGRVRMTGVGRVGRRYSWRAAGLNT